MAVSDLIVTKPGGLYRARQQAELAAALAEEHDITAEVIDLRTLSPWDEETVFASVRKTGRAIVAYEDSLSWGYGAEIAARLALSEADLYRKQRVAVEAVADDMSRGRQDRGSSV